MKKHFKRTIFSILSIITLLCTSFPVNAETIIADNSSAYTIETPYIYPIVPGTSDWNAFNTHTQKIEACQIPENLLHHMTTQALLETVLDYPLLSDMLVYNTPYEGFDAVCNSFNGLSELTTREDAQQAIQKSRIRSFSEYSLNTNSTDVLCPIYLNVFSKFLSANSPALQNLKVARAENRTLKTPKQSTVYAIYNQTWSDVGATAQSDAKQLEATFRSTYPNATKVRDMTPAYNCHSYAWYSTSSSNKYWINDPSPYLGDGSYTMQKAPKVGYKVYQANSNGSPIHSGIVLTLNFGGSNKVGMRSKWGMLGVYEHSVYDSPYKGSTTETTYWK